jgi:hypothetical protein
MSFKHKNEKGLVALMGVMIISGILITVGLSAGYLNSSQLILDFQRVQSQKSYYAANLCAEYALMELKKNANYSGGQTLNLEEGTCQILQVEGQWTLKVSADVSNQIRKIKIIISRINPLIVINSWQEVPDF